MSKDVLHTIEEKMGEFSKGQKRIAQFILEDYDKAAFITASRMGQTAGVSESTVVRFAAALGYSGYPELQRDLQEVIRTRLTSIQRIQASNALYSTDAVSRVMGADMETLRTDMESVDREAFEEVIHKLVSAKHIYILGARSSAFLAGYLHFYLHLIFENVTLITSNSPGEIIESLLRIGPGDVLVGISFPRYANATVNGIRYAHDRGAEIVALTDSPVSPIYEEASVALLAHSEMISFVDSLIAPMSLINAIIVAAGHRKNTDIPQIFNQLEGIWDKYGVFGQSNEE